MQLQKPIVSQYKIFLLLSMDVAKTTPKFLIKNLSLCKNRTAKDQSTHFYSCCVKFQVSQSTFCSLNECTNNPLLYLKIYYANLWTVKLIFFCLRQFLVNNQPHIDSTNSI